MLEELATCSLTDVKRRLDKAMASCSRGALPTGIKVKAVTCLKNGGILMELTSEDAVAWFWDVGVWEKFLEKFHPEVRIKSRDYHVVAQFISLNFQPDMVADIVEVEETNGMDKGDIIRARWIKPIARRVPHQTCRHPIFTFQTPQAANEVLVNGMFVQQKKIYAEKCKREPLCCLRCHRWGHMVHDCSASGDTCGMCMHRTDTCTNMARPHCVSCGRAGHASWARSFPMFQCKCSKIDEWLEDNKLPYFPTDEAWTQVREPPKVIYVVVPPPPTIMSWRRFHGPNGLGACHRGS